MKTTVKFNRNNQLVDVSNFEILKRSQNQDLKNYLLIRENYLRFCNNQTKTGQARKNERAKVRQRMFAGLDTDLLDKEILKIRSLIELEKDSKIEKITVEIEFDGRKKNNFAKITQGVKMAIFTGGLSPQYYGLGLKDFKIT